MTEDAKIWQTTTSTHHERAMCASQDEALSTVVRWLDEQEPTADVRVSISVGTTLRIDPATGATETIPGWLAELVRTDLRHSEVSRC